MIRDAIKRDARRAEPEIKAKGSSKMKSIIDYIKDRPHMLHMTSGITARVWLPELDREFIGDPTDDMIDRAFDALTEASRLGYDSEYRNTYSTVYLDGPFSTPGIVEFCFQCVDPSDWEISG